MKKLLSIILAVVAFQAQAWDQRAPRFAQLIGALFAFTALLGGLTGNTTLFLIATGFALGAAFLNAAFGFCLVCQMYLGLVRLRSRFARS